MFDAPAPSHAPPLIAHDCALFLDFDGTLARIGPANDTPRVAPELPGVLQDLRGCLHGAVALVSGRRLIEIDSLLSPLSLAGAGLLGAELRLTPGGGIDTAGVVDLTRLSRALQDLYCDDPRIGVECGECSVRLDYSLEPARARECRVAMSRLATARTLEFFEDDRGIEARLRGSGKGYGLRMLLEEPVFRGRRPVFVGDGNSDEEGFRAASAMGGLAIKVGQGASCAGHRLDDVDEVLRWLDLSLQDLSGRNAAP